MIGADSNGVSSRSGRKICNYGSRGLREQSLQAYSHRLLESCRVTQVHSLARSSVLSSGPAAHRGKRDLRKIGFKFLTHVRLTGQAYSPAALLSGIAPPHVFDKATDLVRHRTVYVGSIAQYHSASSIGEHCFNVFNCIKPPATEDPRAIP